MPNLELLRIVDSIARDKNISRDQIYTDIEQAVASALRKHFNTEDTTEFTVAIDRQTGDISATRNGQAVPLTLLGRIAAQTAKQVLIQLLRQDERGSIYEEFKDRVGTIVTGTVARFDGPIMFVTVGRAECIMPRSEQIPGEEHQVGQRIQALVREVRDTPGGVRIILSRSHPDMVRRLFEREVPEVGEHTIELKALAREPGHRTKIAVSSIDSKVDAVGACVGVRGSRIKNIVDELGGEKIDIVRWNESSQIFISNALKPAEVAEVSLCFELGRATVVVAEDQLSLAIGKRGQNVRLAAKLTGWDIDILTPAEFKAGVDRLDQTLKSVPGVTQEMCDKIVALGLINVFDIEEVGAEPLVEEVGMDADLARRVVERCTEEAKVVAAEQEAKKAAQALAAAEAASAPPQRDARDEAVLAALGLTPGRDPLEKLAQAAGDDAGAEPAGNDETAKLPDPRQAVPGGAPETTVHKEQPVSSADTELSPEEQAVSLPDSGRKVGAAVEHTEETNADTAALAEGRAEPPASPGR